MVSCVRKYLLLTLTIPFSVLFGFNPEQTLAIAVLVVLRRTEYPADCLVDVYICSFPVSYACLSQRTFLKVKSCAKGMRLRPILCLNDGKV